MRRPSQSLSTPREKPGTGFSQLAFPGWLRQLLLVPVVGLLTGAGPTHSTPREVFLEGLSRLEASEPGRELQTLAELVADCMDRPLDTQVRRAGVRSAREAALIGLAALCDPLDHMSSNPLARVLFGNVVRPTDRPRRDRVLARLSFAGRPDAVLHFFLSAGLSVAIGYELSTQVGLVKEEQDARRLSATPEVPGQQGYSYMDLAYDLAGIEFARAVLGDRDPRALAQPAPPLATFVDPIAGLSLAEGLDWESYQQRFGGRLDPRHQAVLALIQRSHPRTAIP